ncbi:hypothetical protein VNI00_010566 [Paramarasmius palmivorus]|uniref:Uncharacterized protein n=1 Tax=Paramarasmius palmivorus TaxID=297713 RepID=A0AAW0CGS4_9AGAR
MLPINQLVRLRSISNWTLANVNQYYKTAFGASPLYGRYFNYEDQTSFRSKLAKTGAIVTTLSLVHILSRQPVVQPSKLYVYSPAEHVQELGIFLAESKYKFSPLPPKTTDDITIPAQAGTFEDALRIEHSRSKPNTGNLPEFCDDSTVSGVFNFKKDSNVICIVGTRTGALEIILSFHSTLFMNLATANQIISLYPMSSFVRKEALVLQDLTPTTLGVLQTFEAEGWRTTTTLSGEQALSTVEELSFQTRYPGDHHTWTIDMEPTVSPDTNRHYRALRVSSWHLTCPDIDTTSLTFERLEFENLGMSIILTSEAEKAVWGHPCFFEQHHSLLSRCTMEIIDTNNPASSDNDSDSECSMSTTDSLLTALDAEMNQYRYTVTSDSCNHSAVFHYTDFESAVTEYLRGFYPLMKATHESNLTVRKIRAYLLSLDARFPSETQPILHPSGHALVLILDTLENIRKMGHCHTVRFELDFTLATATNTITTICTVVVPGRLIDTIREELSRLDSRDESHFTAAGVLITFEGYDDII